MKNGQLDFNAMAGLIDNLQITWILIFSEVLLTDYFFNQQVVGLFGHDSDDLD